MRITKKRLGEFTVGLTLAEEFLALAPEKFGAAGKMFVEDSKELLGGILAERDVIKEALEVAKYGGTDGAHGKQWVIDQMVRILAGDDYTQWIAEYKDGEDGPDTYEWDEGLAP